LNSSASLFWALFDSSFDSPLSLDSTAADDLGASLAVLNGLNVRGEASERSLRVLRLSKNYGFEFYVYV
jgi:hypothetical protein